VAVGTAMVALFGSLLAWNTAAQAAFPGLPGKLACVRELRPSGNLEIQTLNPDGSDQRNITNNAAQDYNPIWSPDAKTIVFESERLNPGVPELFTMSADGSNPQPLVVNGTPDDRAFAFHPDGSQIVFQTNRDGNTEIYKMNADGTGQTNLTNNVAADANADWSPDGTRIIWDSARTGNREIWSMDPFGGNLVQLTSFSGEDSGARWSPDGSQIAFQRNVNGNFDIFVMNADGSNVRNLTNHPNRETFAAWSPDGTKIAFTSYRDEPLPFGEIYVMNAADGSDVRRITFTPGFDGRCDWQRICTITGSGDITGTGGNDVICGSPGPDRIAGLGGNDIIYGFGGDDQISGGPGNDTMFGGLGTDSLVGGTETDFSSAGPGDDRIVADLGERIDVGAGTDRCSSGSRFFVCPPRLS
jgi:dipeptidyl aminopeptidase/acylaminoacyl peptidase